VIVDDRVDRWRRGRALRNIKKGASRVKSHRLYLTHCSLPATAVDSKTFASGKRAINETEPRRAEDSAGIDELIGDNNKVI